MLYSFITNYSILSLSLTIVSFLYAQKLKAARIEDNRARIAASPALGERRLLNADEIKDIVGEILDTSYLIMDSLTLRDAIATQNYAIYFGYCYII